MSKLTRITNKLFGSTAGAAQIGQFGSYAAASPATTTDPAVMQSLANWLTGWFGAVVGGNSPAIEDMNAVHTVYSYQLGYILQEGVPEWDSGTTYYIGSIVQSTANLGMLYVSLTDSNTGNALTDFTKWQIYGGGFRTVTTTDAATIADSMLRCDATSGGFVETLPTVATAKGKRITIKVVNTNANKVTVKGNGAEILDGANTYDLNALESATFFCNGTTWDIL